MVEISQKEEPPGVRRPCMREGFGVTVNHYLAAGVAALKPLREPPQLVLDPGYSCWHPVSSR